MYIFIYITEACVGHSVPSDVDVVVYPEGTRWSVREIGL